MIDAVLGSNAVYEIVTDKITESCPQFIWISGGTEEEEGCKELSKTCTSLHLVRILEAYYPLAIVFKETMCDASITEGRIKECCL
jgi:hypothetical protein